MGFFEKLGFTAKQAIPENIPPDASLEAATPAIQEAGPETEHIEVAPEIQEQLANEMQTLESVPKPASGFKRKLQRSAAFAMAALTMTAAIPSFAEAGSRKTPGRAVENGIVYVIDSYFHEVGQSMEDARKAHERQQREAEKEARRQQLEAEKEAKRQRLEAERAAKDQEKYERKQQAEEERLFRQQQAEFRKKLNQAIDSYNRQLKDIQRSYEGKKYGAPGTPTADNARVKLSAEARQNYIQQVIDTKQIYGQELTEQEKQFLDEQDGKTEAPKTQAPSPESEPQQKI